MIALIIIAKLFQLFYDVSIVFQINVGQTVFFLGINSYFWIIDIFYIVWQFIDICCHIKRKPIYLPVPSLSFWFTFTSNILQGSILKPKTLKRYLWNFPMSNV